MEYPGIFFFPLSEPTPVEVFGIEKGVLARRIPDFLCTCLNDDGQEHAGLLEIRAADEDGMPTGDWASLSELPAPDDVMSFLPDEGVEAAVIGTLRGTTRLSEKSDQDGDAAWRDPSAESGSIVQAGGLEVEVTLIRAADGLRSETFPWRLDLEDPGGSCVELARRIAKAFSVPMSLRTWARFGTRSSRAFLHFLRGLDGAACLDPDVVGNRTPKELLLPFVEALEEDPDFGLALRRLHVTMNEAVQSYLMSVEDGLELLDRAYACYPSDTEAAASIGEHLAALDERDRAEDWLRLAVNQPEPPATALETLGILLANNGDTVQARNLWLTGVRVDGHPDFFAHLARLAFTEDLVDEAWDKVMRGLRRIFERSLHPGEWGEEAGRGGVLLRYLSEHLEEIDDTPPADVVELLVDLCEQIQEPEDRLDLGICLANVERPAEARNALRAALPHVEDPDRRDVGAQYLAELLFRDFDENLSHVANLEKDGEDVTAGINFLTAVIQEVPQFWPAHYFRGKLHDLREHWREAYESFRQAATLRRDQPQIFLKLALAARRLGEIEDACTAMANAVELEPTDAGIRADHALLLHLAGREEEARGELEVAETLAPDHELVRKVRERMHRPPEAG